MLIPATKRTNGPGYSISMERYTKLLQCWIGGTNPRQRTSKSGRRISGCSSCVMTSRPTNGRCKAVSTVTTYWRDLRCEFQQTGPPHEAQFYLKRRALPQFLSAHWSSYHRCFLSRIIFGLG